MGQAKYAKVRYYCGVPYRIRKHKNKLFFIGTVKLDDETVNYCGNKRNTLETFIKEDIYENYRHIGGIELQESNNTSV